MPRSALAEMSSDGPWQMAATGLFGFHRVAREVDHRVAHPHLVGRVAARNHQRVEILHPRRAGGEIRRDDGLAALAGELGAGRRSDDRDRRAGGAQRIERSGQLAIFELFLDQHRDALAGEHRSVAHAAILSRMS